MIVDIFPTQIVQCENLLETNCLSELYNFVILNQNDIIVTPTELPALSILKTEITKQAELLKSYYNFTKVEVSDRFCTHYFPAGKDTDMELHSDDLGDYGRKFIAFFYLEADQSAGGELEIFDPRWVNAPWRNISQGYSVTPQTNKLVIFPTFLWHKVNMYRNAVCPRMAIDVVIRIS
jgi:hypothetical protein